MIKRIQQLIDHLHLLPHPEGGYYIETYRSKGFISKAQLPNQFNGNRNFSTAIYFLIPGGQFSAFHVINSDELWHFYEGVSLYIYMIHQNGKLEIIRLGKNIEEGEVFQAVVPAGCWFASKSVTEDAYSLVGCTVAPGFDFADFTLAERKDLIALYPQHEKIITELTRANL